MEAGSGVEVPAGGFSSFSQCSGLDERAEGELLLRWRWRWRPQRAPPGRVDRVRDQENEGSTGSFVYIECDRVRKCIRLPPTPRPHSALSTPSPLHSVFQQTGNMWGRRWGGGGERERETEREEGRVICSGGNSTVK